MSLTKEESDYFDGRVALLSDLGLTSFESLKTYIEHLWLSNQELNLISRKMSFEELIDNHLVDCALPFQLFPRDAKRVADFGTGGGLPALIYAIEFPEVEFLLFEKSVLKQSFLKSCQAFAPNISVIGEIPQDGHLDVDLVTARAFKPIPVILQMSLPYYQKKGRYFLLKARREKIEEELGLSRKIDPKIKAQVIELNNPILDVERHLVLI